MNRAYLRQEAVQHPAPGAAIRRERLPGQYLPLLAVGLIVSLAVALIGPGEGFLQFATVLGAAIAIAILVRDFQEIWRGGTAIGRASFNLGMLYWFWSGALGSAFAEPPFPSPDTVYPYIAETVPGSVVATGLVCLNLFAFFAMLGWSGFHAHRLLHRPAIARTQQPGPNDVACLLLVLLAWVPALLSYEFEFGLALQEMAAMRGEAGRRADPRRGRPSACLSLRPLRRCVEHCAHSDARARNRTFPVPCGGDHFPLVFLGASRFNLGFLLLPAVLVLYAKSNASGISWATRRRFGIAIAALIVGLIGYQGLVRNIGLVADDQEATRVSAGRIIGGHAGSDHFGAMLLAIDLIDVRGGYFHEFQAPYLVTHFIPRSVWPDKPYPESWLTYNAEVTQGMEFNVTHLHYRAVLSSIGGCSG